MSRKRFTFMSLIAAGAATILMAGPLAVSPAAQAAEDTAGDPVHITVGSANFAENQLIALIYSGALSNAGIDVTNKLSIGSREIYMRALQDGSIDLIPEYSGTLLSYLNPETTATKGPEILKQLKTELPKGIIPLQAASAQDRDELVVKKSFAEKHHLKTISDLVPIADQLTLAGPPEWKTRHVGVPGLKEVYGLTFDHFKILDAGGPLTLTALVNGQVQVGDMFSSDPAVAENGLVALEDDKNLFTAAQVLPIIRADKATPEVREVLNKVSAALTQDELIALNRRSNAGDSFKVIARDWLKKHHFE